MSDAELPSSERPELEAPREATVGWSQEIMEDSAGEKLGEVHEIERYFASCDLCSWCGEDRDCHTGSMADLRDHLSDEHGYGATNE